MNLPEPGDGSISGPDTPLRGICFFVLKYTRDIRMKNACGNHLVSGDDKLRIFVSQSRNILK